MQLNLNITERVVDLYYEIKRQKMKHLFSPGYMLALYNLLLLPNLTAIVYDNIHWQIQELEDMVQIP